MTLPRDKKRQRMFLLRLVGSAIALGLVAFLIYQNWSDFIEALGSLPVGILLGALLLAFLSRIMVTLRWFVLLRVVEPQVQFWDVLKLSFVGLFTTNVLPSTIGGDVVKLGGAVQGGLDSAGVTASLVIDRLVGMATMATFLPLGIGRIVQANLTSSLLVASGPGVFFARIWQKLFDFITNTWQSLKLWFKEPRNLLIAAAFSLVHMASTFTMVVLILDGLGDSISWWTAGGLWVLVYFITLVPVSINGLGLQEASLSLVYVSFAGVSESSSLVLALLMRVLFMIASLPGAFFLPSTFSGDRKAEALAQQDQLNHE